MGCVLPFIFRKSIRLYYSRCKELKLKFYQVNTYITVRPLHDVSTAVFFQHSPYLIYVFFSEFSLFFVFLYYQFSLSFAFLRFESGDLAEVCSVTIIYKDLKILCLC